MVPFKPGTYYATIAPLVVKDKVIVGIGGGEQGMRCFIDAYDAATGKRAWRFWTIPAKGEPGGDTWAGESGRARRRPAWLTGTYDPQLEHDLLGLGQSGSGPIRRRTAWRQPLFVVAGGARSGHR